MIATMKTMLVALAFLSACPSKSEQAREETKVEQSLDVKIKARVIFDAIQQYEFVKRNGDPVDICLHAGIVTAGWLDAKHEDEYRRWKAIEKADCKVAGM